MHRRLKAWVAAWRLSLLVVALMLPAACSGSRPSAQSEKEPAAIQPAAPTATQAATATTAPTATKVAANTTAPSDEATATVESSEGGRTDEEVAFSLPTKGSASAPVTILEFSDYL